MKGLIPYAIALAAIATVAVAQQPTTPQSPPEQPQPATTRNQPRRLTITVSVADPADLKVKQGDRLTQGQLIADCTRERDRLQAQKQQLTLTLERQQGSTISAPLPPATQPPILDPSYLEENAAIARAGHH
ncbi:MAG: hypothetical protein F6K04_21040 [Leptolyngbya sp. SIO4C5]|nr:hypothetical protein [Leptolyngbya sp. SIO4C5]